MQANRGNAAEAEITRRPNLLKRKLGGNDHARGQISDEAVRRAEQMLSRSHDRYLLQAQKDVADLQSVFAALRRDRQEPAVYLERLSAMGREIKGQAGTFGYDLLTRFGDSLYELTRTMRQVSDRQVDLIGAHIDAIEIVVKQDIRGAGGAVGQELSASLRQAIQRVAVSS